MNAITFDRKAFIKTFKQLKKEQQKKTHLKMTTGAIASRGSMSKYYLYHIVAKNPSSARPLTIKALQQLVFGLRLTHEQYSKWIKDITPKNKYQEVLIQDVGDYQRHQGNNDKTAKQIAKEPIAKKSAKSKKPAKAKVTVKQPKSKNGKYNTDVILGRVKKAMHDKGITEKNFIKKSTMEHSNAKAFLQGKLDLNKVASPVFTIARVATGIGTSFPALMKPAKTATKPKKSAPKRQNKTNHKSVSVNYDAKQSTRIVANAREYMDKHNITEKSVVKGLTKSSNLTNTYATDILRFHMIIKPTEAKKLAKILGTTLHNLMRNSRVAENKIKQLSNKQASAQSNASNSSSASAQSSKGSSKIHITPSGASDNAHRSSIKSNFRQVDVKHGKVSHTPARRNSANLANTNKSHRPSSNNIKQPQMSSYDYKKFMEFLSLKPDTIELAKKLQQINATNRSILSVYVNVMIARQNHIDDVEKENTKLRDELSHRK